MAAVDGIEELRTEIERLSRELDLASTEKIQSAQYGLALLEEKSALQQRCNDLEALYENTKHELEITQEVSACPGSWVCFFFLLLHWTAFWNSPLLPFTKYQTYPW